MSSLLEREYDQESRCARTQCANAVQGQCDCQACEAEFGPLCAEALQEAKGLPCWLRAEEDRFLSGQGKLSSQASDTTEAPRSRISRAQLQYSMETSRCCLRESRAAVNPSLRQQRQVSCQVSSQGLILPGSQWGRHARALLTTESFLLSSSALAVPDRFLLAQATSTSQPHQQQQACSCFDRRVLLSTAAGLAVLAQLQPAEAVQGLTAGRLPGMPAPCWTAQQHGAQPQGSHPVTQPCRSPRHPASTVLGWSDKLTGRERPPTMDCTAGPFPPCNLQDVRPHPGVHPCVSCPSLHSQGIHCCCCCQV